MPEAIYKKRKHLGVGKTAKKVKPYLAVIASTPVSGRSIDNSMSSMDGEMVDYEGGSDELTDRFDEEFPQVAENYHSLFGRGRAKRAARRKRRKIRRHERSSNKRQRRTSRRSRRASRQKGRRDIRAMRQERRSSRASARSERELIKQRSKARAREDKAENKRFNAESQRKAVTAMSLQQDDSALIQALTNSDASSQSPESGGMSTGVKIGIAVGAVALIGVVVLVVMSNKKKGK